MERTFVGRDGERKAIAAAAERARAGAPQVVSITGVAGAGKTALVRRAVRDLAEGATGDRPTVLTADELAGDVAYALLRPLVDVDPSTHPLDAGMAALEAISSAHRPDGLATVVIEDLHWADQPSRQALAAAARRLEHEPVLVVVTARPEHLGVDDGWDRVRADPDLSVGIALGELGWAEVAALAEAHGVPLDERAARRLQRHTRGNPLHALALLDEVPAATLARGGDLPAPRTFAASVGARVASLGSDAAEVVAALAVLARPTAPAGLAVVAAVDDPGPALDELVDAGLVIVDHDDAAQLVRIVHPLTQAAILAGLATTTRRAMHRRAAGIVGHREGLVHRVASAEGADEGLAADLEREAGLVRPDDGALAAARLLRWSSEASAAATDRERRLLDAARLLLVADDRSSLAALRPLIEACAPTSRRDLVVGQIAWVDRDVDRAMRSLARAADGDDPADAAEALTRLAAIHVARLEGEQALSAASSALALEPTDELVERQAWAYRASATAQIAGPRAGLALVSERLPERPEDVATDDAPLLLMRGILASVSGRHRAATADLEAFLRGFRQVTAAGGRVRAHVHLAASQHALGRWDEALVNARLAIALADEGHPWARALPHPTAAAVLAGRGLWAEAEEHVAAAREAAVASGLREERAAALESALAVHLARADAEAIVSLFAHHATPPSLVLVSPLGWFGPLAAALIDVGRVDDGERWIDALSDGASLRGLEIDARLEALRGRLAAASGDAKAALAHLSAAVGAIGSDTPVLDQIDAHHLRARLLRSTGRRKEAVGSLRQARTVAASVGARAFLDRIDRDLDEAGLAAAERGGTRSRLDLTPREQDVATLAISGRTNKEIAADLYVSVKAVEYHLRNVYGKLGIDSRRQLENALADS